MVAGAAAAWALWLRPAPEAPAWRTAPLTRRDVQRVVSSTGALTADPIIDVGTQVSGIVAELLVDFNDDVVAGQVLARIDPTLLQADVAAANARLAEAAAHRQQGALDLARLASLHERQAATDQELELAQANAAVAEAVERTAQVAVDRTRRNLSYATITAPVAGTIVKRSVTLGQTVNAGFSAPVLFSLARDLSRMIILANVDESDVGLIREGQAARFTVQTWPERSFTGTVRQVRMDAKVEQGVVTYTTVITVENTDGALFPSMTATVEFIVAEALAVWCAPNAALRFKPDTEVATIGTVPAERESKSPRRGVQPTEGVVWTPEGSVLRALPVTAGIRGAECTEVSGEGLTADLPLATGVDREADTKGGSPFSTKGATTGKHGGF